MYLSEACAVLQVQYPSDVSDDNKYAKNTGKAVNPNGLSKYKEALSVFENGINCQQLKAFFQDSFVLYSCYLMLGTWLYHHLGGSFSLASREELMGYASAVAEAFGLLVLRRKIQSSESVKGVSGMTMVMYAVVYAVRELVLLPGMSTVDEWAVQILSFTSLVIVLDILKSVFVRYRSSYQEELDVLRAKWLIPSCIVFAAVLHPSLEEGPWFSFFWTSCLYLDVMALMPQIIMMERGAGKVSAPICHFVAATAVSRMVDLWFWLFNFQLVGDYMPGEFHFSGWLIIFFHVLHLLLVADFMYYYVKARLSGSSFSEDLSLPTIEV